MDEENQTLDNAASAQGKEDFLDAVVERFKENITRSAMDPLAQGLTPGVSIPQRLYCQGTSIPDQSTQIISFAMANGRYFPAENALSGRCENLVDRDGAVFTEQNQTINLRIEWPGYDGWGAQIRIVNYQDPPKSINRAKLVTEIAKQLDKFIEIKQSTVIDPAYAMFKVGPGGVELRHLYIASLERVSRGSWQPCFIYSGP